MHRSLFRLSNPVSGFGPTLPRRAIGPIDKYLDTNITHRHRGYFLGKPFMNDISQQTGDFYSRTSRESSYFLFLTTWQYLITKVPTTYCSRLSQQNSLLIGFHTKLKGFFKAKSLYRGFVNSRVFSFSVGTLL